MEVEGLGGIAATVTTMTMMIDSEASPVGGRGPVMEGVAGA